MKKFLAILICAIMCVTLLAACDMFKHEHTKSDWKYSESEHWRVLECNRNNCAIEDAVYDLGAHVDDNEDGICDICEFPRMPEFAIEWKYSETHHWWVPDGISVGVVHGYGEHKNDDADLFCDVCGYALSK